MRDEDECFSALEEMNLILNNDLTNTITMAPCCLFSHTIPEGTKATSSNPPKPLTIHKKIIQTSSDSVSWFLVLGDLPRTPTYISLSRAKKKVFFGATTIPFG